MRVLAIVAAAGLAFMVSSAVQAQTGTGNPGGAQNMDTANKGNPNTPSAGQSTGMKKMKKSKSKKSKM